MSVAAAYTKVLYPDTVRVFGKVLLPVTIGHVLLLQRQGSPAVTGTGRNLGTLVTALYVLTRPCAVAAKGLQTRRVLWLLRAWGWQLRWWSNRADRRKAWEVIEEHIAAAFKGPDLWEKDEPGKGLNAPFLQVMKVRLQACMGWSEEEALNTPLQKAIWDMAAWAEDQGRVDWVSEEDAEAISKLGLD